jgi:hypothetical protein
VLIVQEAGWALVRVFKFVRKGKISYLLLGFKPLAIQPVASGYTDYAIPDFNICRDNNIRGTYEHQGELDF